MRWIVWSARRRLRPPEPPGHRHGLRSNPLRLALRGGDGTGGGRLAAIFCGSRQPVSRVANWGRQVSLALAAAHSAGIVHRDIKPENLMLRPDGYIKVLDFGMARRISGDHGNPTNGSTAGTLRYMSPEQVGEGGCRRRATSSRWASCSTN